MPAFEVMRSRAVARLFFHITHVLTGATGN